MDQACGRLRNGQVARHLSWSISQTTVVNSVNNEPVTSMTAYKYLYVVHGPAEALQNTNA